MHEVAKHEESSHEDAKQEQSGHKGPVRPESGRPESGQFGGWPADGPAGPVTKHGTATVLVFAHLPEGWRVGLIRHPLFGRMMMPGGHIEEEESPPEAALREVAEEAGLDVRLVSPPAAPLPHGYQPPRLAHPWWMVEYVVPPDNHLARGHVHVDHLYVAMADGQHHARTPEHPFGWYAAADLPGLNMFDDARLLATTLLTAIDGAPASTARTPALASHGPSSAGPGSAGPGSAGPGNARSGSASPGDMGPEGRPDAGVGDADAEQLRAAILAGLGQPG